MPKTQWNDSQIIGQLDSGYHWSTSSVSFSFPTTAPNWSIGEEGDGFSAFKSAQKTAAVLAISLWDDVIARDFFEASGSTAQITFANTTTSIGYAHAYFPGSWAGAGSIWTNPNHADLTSPEPGEYGFMTFLHEIGHAIGLDHPGDYNGGSPNYQKDALYIQDSHMYTVMSYFDAENTGADWYASDGQWYYPQTPMLHDVMAIQAIYGAEATTRSGNTVYGFNATADRWVFDFTENPHPVLTISDSGGTDTLDLSGWNMPSRISLIAGTYSNADRMTNNIAIAHGTIIENAVGGGGKDTIIGNHTANRLVGNNGHDVIKGLPGTDKLIGGGGNDILDGGVHRDVLIGGAGADRFRFAAAHHIEWDLVRDFSASHGDLVDFSSIDTFVFIDTDRFSDTAGELRFVPRDTKGVILGDLDGDSAADFRVVLLGVADMSVDDLIL